METVENTDKIRLHAITIDLVTGGVYCGDGAAPEVRALALESARALMTLIPKRSQSVIRLSKDYDAQCHVVATSARFKPAVNELPVDLGEGDYASHRKYELTVFVGKMEPWKGTHYDVLVGSVKDGKVTDDVTGIEDVCKTQREESEKASAAYHEGQHKQQAEVDAKNLKAKIKKGEACWNCGSEKMHNVGSYRQCTDCGATT